MNQAAPDIEGVVARLRERGFVSGTRAVIGAADPVGHATWARAVLDLGGLVVPQSNGHGEAAKRGGGRSARALESTVRPPPRSDQAGLDAAQIAEALAVLRRVSGIERGERVWILAAPGSLPFLLGALLAQETGDAAAVPTGKALIEMADTVVVTTATPLDAWRAVVDGGGTPRRVLCFGTSLHPAVRRALPDAWLNRITLFHGCQASGAVAWLRDEDSRDTQGWCFADGVEGCVVDDRNQPVAPGVVGRLFTVRGGASLWRAQPVGDGSFRIVGRVGGCVMVGRRRVDLDAVEARLKGSPDIRDAAVVALREGSRWVSVRAYVTPVSSTAPTAADLVQRLRAAAPAGFVPDEFRLCSRELPRDGWGVLDRERLLRLQTTRMPRDGAATEIVTPRVAALRVIWAEVLETSEIGPDENFFDLGGTSLAAFQILSRVRALYGVEIEIGAFFGNPTLEGLDALVQATPVVPLADRGPALKRVPRDPPPPLSFAQERLWFLDQFQPSTPFYNVAEIITLNGDPDIAAVRSALDALGARHEALRTVFMRFGDSPAQVVLPPAPVPLEVVDAGGASPAELTRRLGAEIWRPFNLESGPLFRATLFRTTGRPSLLLLTLHHIVTDAWSMELIKREFAELYASGREGRPCSLPQAAVQYADYAVWQRRRLRGGRLDALLRHWRTELEGAPTFLGLPADKPRPPYQSFEGAALTVRIPRDLGAGLRELAQARGTTPFTVLLAAAVTLLHRLTGQSDLVIGTPVINRERPELEQVCGFFANTLLIRSRTYPDECFTELLDRVSATLLAALAHAEMPFEKLVEELQPERNPGHNPLFQAMFVYQDRRGREQEGADAAAPAGTVTLEQPTSKFDLTLHAVEDAGGILLTAEYATALFEVETIGGWMNCFKRMLEALVAEPGTAVAALPLLGPAEVAALTTPISVPESTETGAATLHGLFETWVHRTPRAIALKDGRTELTYQELDAVAETLARDLAGRGVGHGEPVGIHLHRSHLFWVAALAVLKAGGTCLALDPEYPPARLAIMLDDARPRVVLANEPPDWLRREWTCMGVRLQVRKAALRVGTAADPEDPAYIIYTSGSSGRPKGVVMPHRSLVNLMRWQCRRSGVPAPRTLQFAPLSFDVAFQEVFATWAGGGTLVCISNERRRDPALTLATVEENAIERIFLPYVALDKLAQEVRRRGRAPASLRYVVTAGEALKITPDIAAWFERAAHCRLFNQYGPAETHVVTEEPLEAGVADWPVLPPIGRPIDGMAVFIVDERLQPVPNGVVGEIVIAGVAVAHGYLNREEETTVRFVELPATGQRVYRTGDMGRLDRLGRIEFLGRRDHQLKVRGFRVEAGEIESALKATDVIVDAVVTTRGDSAADRQLVAFVVPSGSTDGFDPAPVLSELRRTLPEPLRPAVLIPVPEIPLTPSGKQDRLAMARLELPSSPGTHAVPPRTELERRIASVWRRILRSDAVGVTDNFFELGGHSLAAMRLVAELGDLFRIHLPVRAVFEAPTIEELSREVVLFLARISGRSAS